MPKLSHISILVASALASYNAIADSATTLIDEQITVTATRTPRHFMESPAAVAVVSAEDIKRSSANSIADALQDVPGIQITDAATPGMKRITLRGESSLRVAVLVDGQEITDHSTYGAPLLLDTSMVERVEVIRGTSSVLYGGKALGGVINIITKKGGSEPIQATVSAGYHSATKGQQYAGSVFGYVNGFDYRISASSNDHEDRKTPEGKLDDTSFDNNSVSVYLAKEINQHHVGVNFEQFNLSSEIATGIPDFFLNMPQRDREKLSAFYTFDADNSFFKKAHFNVYDQTIDRNFVQHVDMSIPLAPPMSMNMSIDTNIQESLDTFGANSQFDFAIGESHYLIAGIQHTKDDLVKATNNKTVRTVITPFGPGQPSETIKDSTEDATLETNAIYLQDEWRATEQVLVTLGGRYYKVDAQLNSSSRDGLSPNSNDDSHFIASAAANYAIADDSNMRIVFSQGYHYPTLLQIATGATAAGSFINPNANLKPEESDNIELGYRFFNKQWQMDATYFYTDAENYITTRDCQNTGLACVNVAQDKVYINADNAKTTGLEFSVKHSYDGKWSTYANLTWLSREETYGSFSTKDTGTPSLYGRVGVNYENQGDMLKSYYIDTYIRLASDADVAYADGSKDVYDSWKTVNIAFGTNFGPQEQYSVNAEFTNIFDKQYSPANETLLAPGRALTFKVSANF